MTFFLFGTFASIYIGVHAETKLAATLNIFIMADVTYKLRSPNLESITVV